MKILVAGWFSFARGHATAGDLLSRDVLCRWLDERSIAYNLATDPPFAGGLNWRLVDPGDYSHVIFVCGPFGRGEFEAEFLGHFARCRLIGLNLSMDLPLDEWNPFDLLIERDSSAGTNPDIVFAARQELPPVVGVCFVEEHPGAEVARANAAIAKLIAVRELAVVGIDTRLDVNEGGLRTPGEVEALIARVDVLITTRLHGLVLALKNGVPALAIDTVPGSGKITKQCTRVGWPSVLTLDQIDERQLAQALDFALSPEARRLARACASGTENLLLQTRERLLNSLASDQVEASFRSRQLPQQMEAFRAGLQPVGDLPAERNDVETPSMAKSWRSRVVRGAFTMLRRG
ncbi:MULTISPECIES: polysaccharide pyruvyl transferase family protein [unclassified Mesorhizobium]|uniref:polysaccharide pyruvyl transferase family protein n=1 Tax=unclassified Mesorhizobium TaxID=325217 RepID=UPI000FCA477E|nr:MULTISPECIES: polysaccharide pyruvyl transferase family protein [unclassified Mesorhizobium]TIT80843.1 MAG: polysaccharide pyruvyl transferase family protein [Mesorhizobium sp.]TGP23417.1 polysaccharide pyruvyl transferase family protein [Mesorhizobium sp. M1D.F.Ca.ET.231.01.1.1]TGP33559.1 polysaccharide pyruvyl transferase family protein [Mesorhizobium sp. M1D.F.Ca.ET.234.01.1.1]TGS46926.1 polysaccharide pyruvyl transferase family protein [Mesorhizobium sp. M1D.F.Ca.ET.184.01.1.1]TGS62185.